MFLCLGQKQPKSIIPAIMTTNFNSTIDETENTRTPSSGNMYADLGYENPKKMSIEAHLVTLLIKTIKAKGLDFSKVANGRMGCVDSHQSVD